MTGLNDTDIRLDRAWQLTRATDGDAPLCADLDCLYQSIMLEALTQAGDWFADASFGWSLYDFIQSEDSDLTRLEIAERVRTKLLTRDVILPETIEVSVEHDGDVFFVRCSFQFTDEDTARDLNVVISAVDVEVVADD